MNWRFWKSGSYAMAEQLRVGSSHATLPRYFRSTWLHVFSVVSTEERSPSSFWDTVKFKSEQFKENKREYSGLLELITAIGEPDYRSMSSGTYDGTYYVRPFTQFLFVSNEPDDWSQLMKDLEKYFKASVGDLVYQAPSFGFVQKRNAGGTRLFFGPGVFAPHKDAQQIGRLEIKTSEGGDWVTPSIVVDGQRKEAGFYAGQWGLTVSTDVDQAPASIPGNALVGQNLAAFTLNFGSPDRRGDPRISWQTLSNGAEPVVANADWTKICGEEGQEVRLGNMRLRVRYTKDIRPQRLRRKPQGKTLLKFAGLVVPTWRYNKTARRATTFVDFDHEGFPVTEPLVVTRHTYQVTPARSWRWAKKVKSLAYSWEDKARDAEFEDGIELNAVEVPGLWGGYLMVQKNATSEERWVDVDQLEDGSFNAPDLMDCSATIDTKTKVVPWSAAFKNDSDLVLQRVDNVLEITSESGLPSLETRVFRVRDGGAKIEPVEKSMERFRSDEDIVIDGILWKVQLR